MSMIIRRNSILISVLMAVLAAPVAAKDQIIFGATESLRNADRIIVNVHIDDRLKELVRENMLTVDVELKFRQSGVKFIPLGDSLSECSEKALARQLLIVSLWGSVGVSGATASIRVSFYQQAHIPGNQQHVNAITWTTECITNGTPDGFEKGVREGIKDLVDEFLNDYMKANPKTE